MPFKLSIQNCNAKLPKSVRSWSQPKSLINTSAKSRLIETQWHILVMIGFFWVKWQSISVCFVRSWKIGLAIIWKATFLSLFNVIAKGQEIPNFRSKRWNQTNPMVVWAISWYSAFVEEWETILFFLDYR